MTNLINKNFPNISINIDQAEIIYNSILHTLRACNIDFEEKHELLQNEILDRHDVTDLLDQLDHLYNFIATENDFTLEIEEE